jgi:hypothetical protein
MRGLKTQLAALMNAFPEGSPLHLLIGQALRSFRQQ